ncbi:juvenile hormone epoxide hydrolase 1-like [Ooceraea biroi]|uniref:juvenile hormone epoxide hydrolase 1-like n=1 Tax=Ooceraea biroi TaxID=2015173 RepID=UPI0005BB6C17|nr:juvenile hormone epoxide hydrolase 1-like [Ooceraea biroi]
MYLHNNTPTISGPHKHARSSTQRFSVSCTFDIKWCGCTMWKTTTVIFVLAIGIAFLFRTSPVKDVPNLPEPFWGPEKNRGASKEIRPFLINVTSPIIDDLKDRLAKRRELVPPLENTAWTYGTSTTYLENILEYWRTKYNWSQRQALLNKHPQYTTNIQGLDIHFYYVKPHVPSDRNVKVLPLLILHGWPGSVVEFQKIIPMLTTPRPDRDFVFEVIAPSLPGFAFSQAPVRPGLGPVQISVIFKNLMLRLGFNKFYVQGGDWGSAIVTHLASLFSDNVLGLHMNLCADLSITNVFWRLLGSIFPWFIVDNEYYSRMYPLSYHLSRNIEESGYLHIQATKPDTIGTAVAASPVGLAAYILEKFSTGTNAEYRFRTDGGLLEKHSIDELLDNIMLYWITNSMTTSARIYAENFNKTNRESGLENLPVNVPSACAAFPHEILYHPENLLQSRYTNLIQYNYLPRGGHFAAMEEPALLADDIFEFVSKTEDIRKKAGNKDIPNAGKKIKEPTKI